MLNTTSFRLPAILLISASALLANNVTGKWSGTVSQGSESAPISFDLRQAGNDITGTILIKDTNSAVKGTMTADEVRLETKAGNDVVHFELSLNGTQLRGTGFILGSNGQKKDVANVTVTFAKAGTARTGISGLWSGTVETDGADSTNHEAFTMRLERNGSAVTGEIIDKSGKKLLFSTGTINGNFVVLTLDTNDVKIRLELTLDGNQLTGKAVATHGAETKTATLTAIKQG